MCLFPIKGKIVSWVDNLTGERKRRFYAVSNFPESNVYDEIQDFKIPCGKCIECLQEYSKQWSYRIMAEANENYENSFITLTYANNPLSLNKRDYQLFLKRLRKYLSPLKIRYFLCGEYGSKKARPHYHLIIFGWCPNDIVLYNSKKNLYGSRILEKLWGNGFVSVGKLTLESAKYCAKYMQKLQPKIEGVLEPFVSMSLKPGLGANYFLKNMENLLQSDKLYFNGKYTKLPRYYLILSQRNLKDISKIQEQRQLKCSLINFSEQDLVVKRDVLKKKFGKII